MRGDRAEMSGDLLDVWGASGSTSECTDPRQTPDAEAEAGGRGADHISLIAVRYPYIASPYAARCVCVPLVSAQSRLASPQSAAAGTARTNTRDTHTDLGIETPFPQTRRVAAGRTRMTPSSTRIVRSSHRAE